MKIIVFALALGTLGGLALDGQTALENSFFEFCGSAARAAGDARAVKGLDGWLFFRPELEHLSKREFWGDRGRRVSSAKNPAWADPLPAIVDFSEQLKKIGIELLFVPVPAKAVVHPDKLRASFAPGARNRLDRFDGEFIKLLAARGVKVVDLLPLFLEHRGGKDAPLYCVTDTHWSGPACELAAAAIAKEIRKNAWHRDAVKTDLEASRRTVAFKGDLSAGSGESVVLRFIRRTKDASLVRPRDDSPVVLMGDSHTLVFHAGGDMYAEGAGLADQLAYELGFPVDLIGVRGSGSTATRVNLYRKAKAEPDYLSRKKVVIWCLSVREFSESADGWRPVPIGR